VHAPGRTVTNVDNVQFIMRVTNTQSAHLEAAWAAGTEFGERLASGMFTLSTLLGMSTAQLTQRTIVANVGLGRVSSLRRFGTPTPFYGETLVAADAAASRPGVVALHMPSEDNVVVA
jgi:acyl dehydratase